MITQYHRLDVIPGGAVTVVHVKQYQTDAVLVFDLYSRLGNFEIPLRYTDCIVRGTKPDGNGYSATAVCDYSLSRVSVQLTEQLTPVAGRCPFEISITDSAGDMITATFILDVQRAALDADTIESDSVIREIQQATEDYINDNPDVIGDIVSEYIVENPEILQNLTLGVEYDNQGNVTLLARNTIPDADNEEF